jgi:hypothetical protein
MTSISSSRHVCGCYIFHPKTHERTYLPQVKLDAHTTIFSTAARTVLTQTFVNRSRESLNEIRFVSPHSRNAPRLNKVTD